MDKMHRFPNATCRIKVDFPHDRR
ncbi:hypothetical protein TNCV_2844391, partial [Trichonephila clavipes]